MTQLTPEGLEPKPYVSHAAAAVLLRESGIDPAEVLVDGITEEGYQRYLGRDRIEFTPWPEDKREAIVSTLHALGEL